MKYIAWLPPEGTHILIVLFLSFLIGLEREERKAADDRIAFGGVRTFPLIGLIGYSMAVLSGADILPQALGFAVVGAFLLMSYWHKLASSEFSGITSEMSGLATYLVGALVYHEMLWVATTLTVASILLLELKGGLEDLAKRIATTDILTFAKFLLLSAVILPLLPNAQFGQFQINPFKTWLVVVAVSAVSYGSYVLQRLTKAQGGIILAALLGGAYSSTVTTVVLARRSMREQRPRLFAGGILIASGMMYLRLTVLLALFNRALMNRLAPSFLVLGALAIGAGWLWSRSGDANTAKLVREFEPKNPLELSAAFLFALLFLVMLVATHLAIQYLGATGVYALAAIMGVTDVDPFILGLTQAASTLALLQVASAGIVIAAASNNVIKGVYAYALSPRQAGLQSLLFLLGLAALGLIPLLWFW
ncbi:MAG TPA: MgtC/SapB family protein [Burkholderiales bacterium]|nr:MgtC/SapB family protein [Burkholderiales bacterium]